MRFAESKRIFIIMPLISLLCALFAARTTAQDEPCESFDVPKENLHVYLLIGQSNMAGRAPFSEEEAGVIRNCYLLNNKDKWEPAKNPLNRYSTVRKGLSMQMMNPGYTFSQTMIENDPESCIGLVVNAKGGTSIKQWMRGSTFYNEALRRTRIAQQSGTLKGILWHQGESDANDPEYLEKLKTLIADLRKDLGEPNLAFVAGEVNNVSLINEQIRRLPDTVPFTGAVSSQGLTVMDRWHFDTASMKLLGQRYAREMIKIHQKQKVEREDPLPE